MAGAEQKGSAGLGMEGISGGTLITSALPGGRRRRKGGTRGAQRGGEGLSTILKDAVTVGLVRYRYDPGANQACGRTNRELTQMLRGQIWGYLFYLQRLKLFLRHASGKQEPETALAQ